MQFPQSIIDLTPEQYRYWLTLALGVLTDIFPAEAAEERMISYLCGLRGPSYSVYTAERIADIEARWAEVRDGYFDGQGTPIVSTPRNLLPEYDGHTGPGDWLSGMTWGEFTECCSVISEMATSEDTTEQASHLARVMYHISDETTPDILLMQHCTLLFGAVLTAIQTGEVDINGTMIDISTVFRGDGKGNDDGLGWNGITYEVAQAGLFGTVPQVEASDMWEVLLYLYKCKKEYDRTKP